MPLLKKLAENEDAVKVQLVEVETALVDLQLSNSQVQGEQHAATEVLGVRTGALEQVRAVRPGKGRPCAGLAAGLATALQGLTAAHSASRPQAVAEGGLIRPRAAEDRAAQADALAADVAELQRVAGDAAQSKTLRAAFGGWAVRPIAGLEQCRLPHGCTVQLGRRPSSQRFLPCGLNR